MVKHIALATTKAENEDTEITKSLFVHLQSLINFFSDKLRWMVP